MAECNAAKLPCDVNTAFTRYDGPPIAVSEADTFRQILGALRWLCLTRVDITFTCNAFCRYTKNPGPAHVAGVKRILRYIAGTLDEGLKFTHGNGAVNLEAYADADFAGEATTMRSIAAHIIRFNPTSSPFSWSCRLQKTPATSTCQAEYVALFEGCREIVHVRGILSELLPPQHLPLPPTILFGDNAGAIALGQNPVQTNRNKHFPTKLHFTRLLVQAGTVRLCKAPSATMWADSLTKALPLPTFALHRRTLHGKAPPSRPDLETIITLPPFIDFDPAADCAAAFTDLQLSETAAPVPLLRSFSRVRTLSRQPTPRGGVLE